MKGKRFISSVLAVMTFWLSSGASALPVPVMALEDGDGERGEYTLGSSLSDEISVDEENFPDETFRNYVKNKFDTDKSGELSREEIEAVTFISVNGKDIIDLSGIEFFPALKELQCSNNQLTSLDLSSNTALEYLYCDNNQLAGLNVSNSTALKSLYCEYNQLTKLDVSNNTALTRLGCSNNQLTNLDVSKNTALTYLSCSGNQITSLDVSHKTDLVYLYCVNNQLTNLDVSYCTALTDLSCSNNQLTNLDVSYCTALTDLSCSNNPLTSLDVSYCTALTSLECYNNQLTNLHVSYCTALINLSCSNNQLTSLDVSHNTALTNLSCSNNQLTSLDVSHNTALKSLYCENNQLPKLDVSNNTALTRLSCSDNQLTSLNVNRNIKLTDLYCSSNLLTNLNVSKNTALKELWCSNNQLTSLDISTNSALTNLSCYSNIYSLGNVDDSYLLDNLPGSFDPSKASNWKGAEYDESTNSLKYFTSETVTYSYNCGRGKIVTFSLTVTATDVDINTENFPDETFRKYVSDNFDNDNNGKLSFIELNTVTDINVSGTAQKRNTVADLSGIEYFKKLKYLQCQYNQITNIDISQNAALTKLMCDNNKLTSLDVMNNTALIDLYCRNNQLTSLDVSKNTTLINLFCDSNQITSLDVSHNIDLEILNINNNQLTSLDISNNNALISLHCNNNKLTSLDVSHNTALSYLFCDSNQLTSLDVSQNIDLGILTVNNNQLSCLDVGRNTELESIYCNNNQLTSLDVSKNTHLTSLECSSNHLTNLDLSHNMRIYDSSFICNENTYSIGTVEDSYPLDSFPGSFDPSKASNWKGAEYDESTNSLINFTSETVTYSYDCGNRKTATFKIELINDSIKKYSVTFPDEIRVYNDDLGYINSGKSVISGTKIYIGMELNSYKDHKVMVNGKKINLYPNRDVYYCDNSYTVGSEDIAVTLEESPWTEEQMADYTILNADEGVRVYWYNKYTGYIVNYPNTIPNGSIIPKGASVCIRISSELYPNMPKMYINGQFQASSLNMDKDWQVWGRYAPYESEFRIKIDGMVSAEPVAEVNESTFPDSSFREIISSKYDLNKDNKLSEDEILRVSYLNISGTDETPGNIESLKGIEYFTELVYLECYNNKISYLDVRGLPKLYLLSCGNNKLTSLDVSKNKNLAQLYCSDNMLTEIDVTNNRNLIQFACAANQISSLDLSNNTALSWLYCSANKLTTLDLSSNPKLETLGINENNLTSLDLSKNTKLKEYEDNDNSYEIALTGDSFNLSDLPAGFDASKAADWQGAEYDSATNSLKNFTGDTVTYNYSCGNGHSIKFTLVIAGGNSINITVQPANTSVIEGLDASFSVTAEGEDITYQWQKLTGESWVDISGETSSVLKLNNVTYDLNGTEYRCVVTAADESVTSGEAVITVKAAEQVTVSEVEAMSIDEVIKFVNAFSARYDKAGKDTAVLTSAQMTAIERVLENDYKG